MVDIPAFSASDLGLRLKQERRAQGLSQAQLAERAGIARQTVIDLEKGKNVSVYVLTGVLASLGKGLQVTDVRPSLDEARAMFGEPDEL